MTQKKSKGFTLLEILLVVGIISILAGIVIVAINPSKQLAAARNTERRSDLRQISNAIQQFYIDHGYYPASSTDYATTLVDICDTGSTSSPSGIDCTDLVDLSELVPTYITAIPTDPQVSNIDTGGTGYWLLVGSAAVEP
jgi:prepilin-type N-terminal cleavage/methylation domain-containing protein